MRALSSVRPGLLILALVPSVAAAQRAVGSAVAEVGDRAYTVIIECDDAVPELGFRTQPNRVTREATGRTNPINVGLRDWKATGEVVVNVDRLVAWIPRPAPTGPILEFTLEMSPSAVVRNGVPTTMTYDRWQAGERFDGSREVSIKATCVLVPGTEPGVSSP